MREFIFMFFTISLIMVVRYFIVCGLFKQRGQKRDIGYSLVSSFIFALTGTILLHQFKNGHTKIYTDISDYGVPWLFISFLMYMFINDTYYYWLHRILHKRSFYKFHIAHHYSKNPTAWTSFAFHPVEALLQAIVVPALAFIIPIHWAVLAFILFIMTMFGVTNHLGHEIYPRSFERKFKIITASHHQNHHHYPGTNFGLFFTFWDQLMGTEKRGSV